MSLLIDFAGLLSLAFAGYALWQSDSAKKAVNKAQDRRDAQDDLERIVQIISVLNTAIKSVTPWIPGKSTKHRAGLDRFTAIDALRDAANILRTNSPLEVDEGLQDKIEESADMLEDLIKRIANALEDEARWDEVRLRLLKLIPYFQKIENKMRNKLAR